MREYDQGVTPWRTIKPTHHLSQRDQIHNFVKLIWNCTWKKFTRISYDCSGFLKTIPIHVNFVVLLCVQGLILIFLLLKTFPKYSEFKMFHEILRAQTITVIKSPIHLFIFIVKWFFRNVSFNDSDLEWFRHFNCSVSSSCSHVQITEIQNANSFLVLFL